MNDELSKAREEIERRQASYMRREKDMQSTLYGMQLELRKLKQEPTNQPSSEDAEIGQVGEREDFIG